MQDGFIFYNSFLQAVESIPDEGIQLEAYKAIAQYGINGIAPDDDVNFIVKALFSVIKPQIDANNKRRAAGKKGGQSTPKDNSKHTSRNSTSTLAEESKHTSQSDASILAENDKHTCTEKEAKGKGKEKGKVKAKEKAKGNGNVKDTHKEKAKDTPARKLSTLSTEHDRYNIVAEHWNDLARAFNLPAVEPFGQLAGIHGGKDKRAQAVDRLNEKHTIGEILKTMDNIAASDFLQGKNDSGWRASLDWFLDPENFRRTQEGNYASKASRYAKTQAKANIAKLAEKLGDHAITDVKVFADV